MAIKHLKITILLLLSAVLTGCPGEEDCDDLQATASVPGLLTITPLQQNYNIGDEIIFKTTVPSSNSFFGNQINLIEATNDHSATLILTHDDLYLGNEIIFIKGSQDPGAPNWFNINYNSNSGNYELEIKIKLNRAGNYDMITSEYIEFQGEERCNRYRIDSSIEGNEENIIAFTVS